MYSLNTTFEEICKAYNLKGEFFGYNTIKSGNINDTYTVHTEGVEGGRTYLVQRINHNVFREPEKIISNVCRITEHIRNRMVSQGETDIKRRVFKMYHTPEGEYIYRSADGNYWRVISYIYNACTFNSRPTAKIMHNAGVAFGNFQKNLADFDAGSLHETIPHFHDTPKRFRDLEKAIDNNVAHRLDTCREEIAYLRSMACYADYFEKLAAEGKISLRVTHNDTKCNNVMFDSSTGEPLAVIDLDTVMPGYAAYDFGDAVRFAANTAAEDEKDLSLVSFDVDMFTQFASGFVPQLYGNLGDEEIDTLPMGGLVVALELATRFLSDYLNGDTYFKTGYDTHNLVRTRCQIALAKDMQSKMSEMNNIMKQF